MPKADYACWSEQSRGRLYHEQTSASRTAFQRDRDRIIHSTAFRRLQYKTQVFVYHEGDHFRTRLTHSMEVAQIARSIARRLKLDEDLAEALALAHDVGHPPFGHAGEQALNQVMAQYGGFDHNAHTLRALTKLEQRYAGFDGLNLTWETLEGVAKHNGPLLRAGEERVLPWAMADYVVRHDLELTSFPGAEAQVAALSDDIAYINHDIDDGLRAGLFRVENILDLPLVGPIWKSVSAQNPHIEQPRLIAIMVREMIGLMVDDVVHQTRTKLLDLQPQSSNDIRQAGRPMVVFSKQMAQEIAEVKAFLFREMYRHFRVNRMTSKAKRIVTDLFGLYHKEPECLPHEWRRKAEQSDDTERARLVCDFIAGMTDRFAMEEHGKLFDLYARS